MAGETSSKSGTLSFSVTCSNSPRMITGVIIQQIVSQTWHPLTGKTLGNINMVMFMFWPPQILKGIKPSQRLEPLHICYGLGYTQLVEICFLSDLSVRWRTKTLEYLSKHIQKSKASADKRLLRSESIPAVSSCCCKLCAGPQRDPWTLVSILPRAGEQMQHQLEPDTSSVHREVRVTTIWPPCSLPRFVYTTATIST